MVDSIRLSLTLVFALHLPILSWMALFNTSQDCDIAAVAHIQIKNMYSVDGSGQAPVTFDPFDQTKPICIGMFDAAKASADLSEMTSAQISAALAATEIKGGAIFNTDTNLAFVQNVSVALLRGTLAGNITAALDKVTPLKVFANQANFEELTNTVQTQLSSQSLNESESENEISRNRSDDSAGFSCDQESRSCRQNSFSGSDLLECISAGCVGEGDNDEFLYQIYDALRLSQKPASQISYNMCGDFFQTLAPYLASTCKQADGGKCDIDKIFANLSDMCSSLETAGYVMYAAMILSYLLVFGVLVNSYETQMSYKWGVALLITYIVTLALFSASFVLYNVIIFSKGIDNYFWQPLANGLENGFGQPLDQSWGNYDKVTVMPDSGWVYLLWIIIMNVALVITIAVSLSEQKTSKDGKRTFGLYKKVGAESKGTVVSAGSMFF